MTVRALVRGVGDIGSAVAHWLFLAGYAVTVHDGEQPTTTRRGMVSADAIFDGRTPLDGVEAIRVDKPDVVPEIVGRKLAVSLVVGDFTAILGLISPDVLIDARMRNATAPRCSEGWHP